jgi:hypothetical protein
MELPEQQVLSEQLDYKVPPVQVQQVQAELQVHKDQKVPLELDLLGLLVPLEQQVQAELQAQKDHKGHVGHREYLGLLVPLAQAEQAELQVHKDHKDHKDQPVRLDHKDQLELLLPLLDQCLM